MRPILLRCLPLLSLVGVVACGQEGTLTTIGPIEQAAATAGGKDALSNAKSESVTASGERSEPGQSMAPGANPTALGAFTYTLNHDAVGDRMTIAKMQGSLIGAPLMYSEVVSADAGYFNGKDNVNAQADQSTMTSARIAAVKKHQRLFHPHLLLRRALQDPSIVTLKGEVMFQGAAHYEVALADTFQPIRLFINKASGVVSKLETVEDDPIRGDVTLEVVFNDYKVVSGISLPHKVTLNLAGIKIHEETRSAITINPTLMDSAFAIPDALKRPKDQKDAERGEAISEYLNRFAALGFSADLDQSTSVQASLVAPGAKAWHITGGAHHTLAIEMNAEIVVVEAPVDDARSRAVIAKIKELIPGKPIKWLINTHHHDDHAGGVRTYVAEGATVVTAASNEAYLKTMFSASHSVRPDALQQKPTTAKIQAVGSAGYEISDTGLSLRKIKVMPVRNSHAEGMLVVHVSDLALLFVADLYSPGFFPPNAVIPVPAFKQFATELYQVLTTDLKALSVLLVVGGHGAGTATVATLKLNAGVN